MAPALEGVLVVDRLVAVAVLAAAVAVPVGKRHVRIQARTERVEVLI
jgi:hypothetical protein